MGMVSIEVAWWGDHLAPLACSTLSAAWPSSFLDFARSVAFMLDFISSTDFTPLDPTRPCQQCGLHLSTLDHD